uniref:Uncharacterized protein n=1 Tax=Solanum tuberosum TaxID=4113 RepID=M0ZQI1_SOLTU
MKGTNQLCRILISNEDPLIQLSTRTQQNSKYREAFMFTEKLNSIFKSREQYIFFSIQVLSKVKT